MNNQNKYYTLTSLLMILANIITDIDNFCWKYQQYQHFRKNYRWYRNFKPKSIDDTLSIFLFENISNNTVNVGKVSATMYRW